MSLAKSALSFAFGTLLSRVLGVVRESVLAAVFGASALLDAFFVANRIPNMLRELAAEGALGSSFTKVFSELEEKDEAKARSLLVHLTVFLCLFFFFFSLVAISFAPFLVRSLLLFDSGNSRITFFQNTVGLTRILFPFIAFMSLASVFAGALHQKGKFFYSSITPMALNMGYILGALLFSHFLKNHGPLWIEDLFAPREIVGLAIGVLLGGFLQMFFLFLGVKHFFFKKRSFLSSYINPFQDEKLKKVFALMWPMVVAASAGQVNVLVNTNFATSLHDGSVSYLNFAFRLFQLPIGVFAVAIGTASLPLLAKNLARDKSYKTFNDSFQSSIELTFWLLIPCMVFVFANSEAIIRFLFERGNFSSSDTYHTASVLSSYIFGLLGYGFVKVFTSFYFALEKIKFAMRVSLFSIVTNVFLNMYFVKNGAAGLAFSTACVMNVSAFFLFLGLLREKFVELSWNKICLMIVFILLSSVTYFVFKTFFLMNPIQKPSFLFQITSLSLQMFLLVLSFGSFYFIFRKFSR